MSLPAAPGISTCRPDEPAPHIYNTAMDKKRYRWLRALGIVALILIVIYGILAINLYSSVGRFPSDYPNPPPHIKNIIWPTIGYPEMLRPGAEMSAEVMLPGGRTPPLELTASLTPARSELQGLSYAIKPSKVSFGPSERWPRGTAHGRDSAWLLKFAVPAGAVPELYDLTINARLADRTVTDSQHNSVAITAPGREKSYSFVSLSDIHVHRRGISSVYEDQSDEGIALDGRPVFFERAIDQVNLLRPDFAVILGDCVRAQHAPGDYQVEFAHFYEALDRFQVPVFMVAGNHDSYVNEVDGATVWQQNIGPLFYSFDAGEAHFTAVNTSQWPRDDRIVMEKLGFLVYPRKWQGQVLLATDERKPETYTGQLAWIRNDLEQHSAARPRFIMMHHDPYRPNGRAISWKNERFAGVFTLGGGGVGSTALKELAAKYRVDYALTGHLHSDYVGSEAWSNKADKTTYANQTMVTYDTGGMQDSYPGYRVWKLRDDAVWSFTYLDGVHSVPLYDGSVLDGQTDMDHLDRLAMTSTSTPEGFTLSSYLGEAMDARGLVGVFPAGSATAAGGRVYQKVALPSDPARELVYIEATAPAGTPGKNSTTPGTASTTSVTVH
jgi:3',5'-cyclic AMP phosphodiesterase CpdA